MKLKETFKEKKCHVARWYRIHGKPIVIGAVTTIGGMVVAYVFGRSIPHYGWEEFKYRNTDNDKMFREFWNDMPPGVVYKVWENENDESVAIIREDMIITSEGVKIKGPKE